MDVGSATDVGGAFALDNGSYPWSLGPWCLAVTGSQLICRLICSEVRVGRCRCGAVLGPGADVTVRALQAVEGLGLSGTSWNERNHFCSAAEHHGLERPLQRGRRVGPAGGKWRGIVQWRAFRLCRFWSSVSPGIGQDPGPPGQDSPRSALKCVAVGFMPPAGDNRPSLWFV